MVCRATDTIYDIACLDVDVDMNTSMRIGGRSIVHRDRWRAIALGNMHRELQANVVSQSFVQEIHHKLHARRRLCKAYRYELDTYRQVCYHPRGSRNGSD